jgi:Protein of unknown function (DUF3237)
MSRDDIPELRLTRVYRLQATLGQPLDLGERPQGHRRIEPLTGGTFTEPELRGELLPGASADWQAVLPDGTAFGDICCTLRTDAGALLYVQSRGVRHGSAEVLARLGRGEDVDASDHTFGTSTKIEAADRQLDWLNKGVFISVGGCQADGVIDETYVPSESWGAASRGHHGGRAGHRRLSSGFRGDLSKVDISVLADHRAALFDFLGGEDADSATPGPAVTS